MANENALQDLAREALAVQDACNLSGVVQSFAKAITRLREALPKAGTAEINTHPVSILWCDKIAHLTGTQELGNDAVMRAYKWAYAQTPTLAEEVADEIAESKPRVVCDPEPRYVGPHEQ